MSKRTPLEILLLPLVLLAVFPDAVAAAEPPPVDEVVARAIGYHDPDDRWAGGAFRMVFRETRPSGADRRTVAVIDNRRGRFSIETLRGETPVSGMLAGADCSITIDGLSAPSAEAQESARWTCERLGGMRDYMTFLWGLPMKLRDPGTRIDAQVRGDRFADQEVWALRVTYDESVGTDTWYVDFAAETGAMIGYRFYHDEAANDGEVIVLEDEIAGAGLRLPKARSWTTHKDDRFLGTDILVELQVAAKP